MWPERPSPRVGYLVKTYPKISETFILEEILALEQLGMSPQILALNPPQERTFHAITSQVQAAVTYVPQPTPAHGLRLLYAHLALLLRHPKRYYGALGFVQQRQEPQRFEEFCQAGYVAWRLSRMRVTHLHAHFANSPAGVAELVHRLIGLPYSITAHAKDIYLSPPAVLDRKMQRARFVLTCTEYNRRFLQGLLTHGTPIYRVYHGVDTRRFQADSTARMSATAATPLILSVGRLRDKKGFPTLLRACRILRDKGYGFRCQIVGYGPLQAEIERLIESLGLGSTVALLGKLTQDDIIDLYQAAWLFVLPCQITEDGDRDGIPNVLLEAMAMQLPVISTPVSGIPELVEHMHHGLLVPPQDPDTLAAAMGLLLDQPHLRQELGQAGREKVCQEFSSTRNGVQIHALLSGTYGDIDREDIQHATNHA